MYVSRANDKPVGCLTAVERRLQHRIEFVAVRPEAAGALRHLGKLLATRCWPTPPTDGQETSTLVAITLGRPVYELLGYRGRGALQMWERRPLT